MATPLLGKLSHADFERLIAPRLGARRDEVVVGPGIGRDAAIIKAGAGRVMVVTTDPLSLIPSLGAADSAWLACHLLASDAWTSGIPPAYASVCLSLPPDLPETELEAYVDAMSVEMARLGIAIVTGHTGRYAGCGLTIVGAATLIGLGDEGRTVGPSWVKPGDRIIVTKGCAIEAAAVAARLFPGRLAQVLDEDSMARARALLRQVSVIADCRAALRVGVRDQGVSALHDATEGGVVGALVELARASVADVLVSRALIPIADECRVACDLLGLDPYVTLSEGTLIATVRPSRAAEVLAALASEGIVAADVGEIARGNGIVRITETDGSIVRVDQAPHDGYWEAYERAIREGWS